LDEDVTCKPELQIITFAQGELPPAVTKGRTNNRLRKGGSAFGDGYTHKLVWKVCPKFEGQTNEMMEGIVDAKTGKVYSFQDTVDYFQAKGDVYPLSNDGEGADGSLQAGELY
jgi:hypothetical protein